MKSLKKEVDVSILVIVTQDDRALLKECLEAIYHSKQHVSFEVILIDNFSSDLIGQKMQRQYIDLRVIRNSKRESFPVNNNKGIKVAKGRYFLILNPDTIIQENTLRVMCDFMDSHEDVGIGGCKLIYPDGDLQLSCRRFPTPCACLLRWTKIEKLADRINPLKSIVSNYLMEDFDHDQTSEVDWVLGAFFMIKRETVQQIGLMYEAFRPPMYVEDVEWCYRAKKAGWKTVYIPSTYTVHKHQRSSAKSTFNRMTWTHVCNLVIFFKKQYGDKLKAILQRFKIVKFNEAYSLNKEIFSEACESED